MQKLFPTAGPEGLLTACYGLSGGLLPVDFRLHAPGAAEVYLIGDMTHWLQDKQALQQGEGDIWHIRLNLRPGQWVYKFEVDGQWLADPANPLLAEDGMGVNEWHSYCFVGDGDWSDRAHIPHGQVIEQDFYSTRLGRRVPFTLYLPPGESDCWPLLTLLHGHQMQANQWPGNGRLPHYMNNLLDQQLIEPFAVLMPAGHHDVDMMRYGHALVDELLPWLAHEFPVAAAAQQRAVAGMSIERFGPLTLALDHPHTFGWVAPVNENLADHVLAAAPSLHEQPFDVQLYCTLEGCAYPRYQQLITTANKPINYTRFAGEPTWRHWNGMTRELLIAASHFFARMR